MVEKLKTDRVPRGVAPLALKLSDAIALAHRVNESASGQANYDLFSQLVGNTKTSSSFQRKVAALRTYGIIEDRDNIVSLSDLGIRLTTPRDERDDTMAAKEAMLRVDLLARMFERHRGRLLPEDVFLNNILIQEFKIPKDLARPWVEQFKDALNATRLTYLRPDGKTQVLDDAVSSRPVADPPTAEPFASKTVANTELPIRDEQSASNSIPIALGRGRIAKLILPADWSAKRDLQRLVKMLQLSLAEDSEAADESNE